MAASKPKRNPYAANIPKYFVFKAIQGVSFGLIVATWVIYLQEKRGFTLAQATIVDIAFWVAAAFAEVPTGVVADSYGRKTSLACGTALMSVSMVAWVFAPTMPLIMLAYASLAIGTTFLTGAEDALFYESVQQAGRDNYAKLAGRLSAVSLGAVAVGSVLSGLLASLQLMLPFILSGVFMLACFFVVLTMVEPQTKPKTDAQPRLTYGQIVRESVKILQARPTLRYPIFYMILISFIVIVIDTVFLQPQALVLGVPLAAIGVVLMTVQLTNMVAAASSENITARVGENHLLYIAPFVIAASLILLGVFQVMSGLLFVLVIGTCTSIVRPRLMNRIQGELHDDIRATVLSMQSLMLTLMAATLEPILGAIADRSGLSSTYFVMAVGLASLISLLFWVSRQYFPKVALSAQIGD